MLFEDKIYDDDCHCVSVGKNGDDCEWAEMVITIIVGRHCDDCQVWAVLVEAKNMGQTELCNKV